jgi:drug/metabolite transporter (DMT)-like permease
MPGARTTPAEGGGVLAGHAALAFVQFCFGLMPVFGKWAFAPGGFEPLSIAVWRVTVGSAVLGGLALFCYGKRGLPVRADLGRAIACAFLGIVFNQALYLEGLSRTSAIQTGLLTCLIPVFTFLVASACGQERFVWTRALGVLVALAGAAPLFLARGAQLELSSGSFFLAGSSLVYACYLVTSKPLLARHPPLVVLAWVYVFSLPGALLFTAGGPILPSDPSNERAWLALAAILVFPTIVAYLLNLFALARVRASTTAVYVYGQILITGAASTLLLGERPTPGILRAAVLLCIGIWLVARRPARVLPVPIAGAPEGAPNA